MEATVSRHFLLFNDAISKEHQEDIQEFLKIFAEKFKINWKRDNTITVRNRHNKKKGANLLIEFKSRHTADVDPNQLKLFETDAEEIEYEDVSKNGNGTHKENGINNNTNIKKLPASEMKQLK